MRLEREAKRELAVRLREAAARERSIQQSLEAVRIKSQADAETMSCRILEFLDEAAESAAAEAQSKRDAAIQQLRRETTEKQKGHTTAIAALQKKLDIEIAERMCLEASVAEMLEDTASNLSNLGARLRRRGKLLNSVYSSAKIVKNVDD